MTLLNLHEKRCLFTAEQIASRVDELACSICESFQKRGIAQVTCIGVLKGSFIFLADLIRSISRHALSVEVEFIGVASYEGTQSTGHVRITHDLAVDIEGKHVVLVEDILDSGVTIDYLLELLSIRKPLSIEICTLIAKKVGVQNMRHPIQHIGFTLGSEFVVGYGLDFNGLYRELPFIAALC